MAITGIDHIGILSDKVDDTAGFYTRIMESLQRQTTETQPFCADSTVLISGDSALEIMKVPGGEIRIKTGLKHIAFSSNDIEEDFQKCLSLKLSLIHREIQQGNGYRFFFLRSPSGEFVEIVERKG